MSPWERRRKECTKATRDDVARAHVAACGRPIADLDFDGRPAIGAVVVYVLHNHRGRAVLSLAGGDFEKVVETFQIHNTALPGLLQEGVIRISE